MITKYWDYKKVEEVLYDMDFELYITKDEENNLCLKVRDLQNCNFGNIEEDTFANFDDLMDRFDMYYRDYYEEPLLEEFEKEIGNWNNYKDLYNELIKLPKNRIKEWEWTINVLGLIAHAY